MWISAAASLVSAVLGGLILLGGQYLILPRLELNKLITQEQWRTKIFARAM
jgi:hypothetical protein